MEWLVAALLFGGIFVVVGTLLSFMGGFAGAIAAGGREDRSLLYNFGIGLLGLVVGSIIWAAFHGEWPEELSGPLLVISFFASIAVALVVNWRERRRAERTRSESEVPGVSV